MTDKIIRRYKQKIEEYKLIPSDGGRFELSVDGEPIYSKLATGKFPDENEMVEQVGHRLGAVKV